MDLKKESNPDSPPEEKQREKPPPHDLSQNEDELIAFLQRIIRMAVRTLAALMTLVIIWGVLDVLLVLTDRLLDTNEKPMGLLTINDILQTFGAFMAVLIAIEIFVNITVYLRDDVIHVKIVMATAMMAIARKVIILDTDTMSEGKIYAIAATTLAMGIGYYLVVVRDRGNQLMH